MPKNTATKITLMETAIALIWQSSYSNVGVAEICKRAGVTKGSFYHYFEGKAELFYEASHHYWQQMKHDLDTIFSPEHKPSKQLEMLISFIVDKQKSGQHYDGNPVSGCPFFTAGGQAGTGEEKVRQASQEMAQKAVQYNAALVRGLKGEDALDTNGDPEQIGRMFYQYIMGLLLYGRMEHSLDSVEKDIREGTYRLLSLRPEYRQTNVNVMKA